MATGEWPTAIVVNDDALQLRLIAALLEKDGLQVIACSNAEDALRVLHSQPAVHVIITDLYMPGIDGWRFCRLLRSPDYASYNHIPILVCSATFAGADAAQMTADLGANAFLPIPYEPAALLGCVHALLTGHMPRTSNRVLIIEDDVAFANTLQYLFSTHGYTVTVARTAASGQLCWQELNPDIVILAAQLPDRAGEAVLAACRRPDALTVVMLLTAQPDPDMALQAMRLGANAYVHKPCEPEYLLALCVKACRERALLRVEDLLEERTRRLRESETQFGLLFEHIPDAVFISTDDGRILAANSMAAQWLECAPEDLPGMPMRRFLQASPGLVPSLARPDETLRSSSERLEAVCQTPSGRRFPVEVHTSPMLFHGQPARLSVARDITERQQAFQQIQAAKDYAENLIQSSLDMIVSVDQERRIIAFNKAAQEAFGYELQEVMGQPVQMLYADAQEGFGVHQSTVHEGRFVGEIVNRRKNGSLFHAYLSAAVLRDSAGKLIGIMGVSRDITARKQAEAALQAAKEAAEVASRTKSAFLANVSHEIRTPLNGILGMTELTLHTALSAEQREYLDTIKASGEALLAIINDLLDCAKIESGKLVLEQRDFSLRRCLDETMKTLAVPAYAKGLTLCYDIGPEVPDMLSGDSGRLRQVLMNLVGNAIKFTAQGDVLVRVTKYTPAASALGKPNPVTPEGVPAAVSPNRGDTCCLHFTVQDTGIGIPVGHQQSIFEPFAQADGSTTRLYGGTGLGLSIASQLVALMYGTVWVESTVGVGSHFHFTACFGQPAQPATPLYRHDKVSDMPVLVVECHPVQRQILERLLTHWGMRPHCVESLVQVCSAVKQAEQEARPFGLLLLDTNIAEWEEIVQAVRYTPSMPHNTPPALVLTTPLTAGDMYRWRYIGPFAWVMKPLAATELWQAIVQAVEQVHLEDATPDMEEEPVECAYYPLRLLLAEDNVVNQRFAARLLEKRGHTVVVASDGLEVLEMFENSEFDLILMDVEMPHLDGLGATAAIRAKERSRGRRVPIVAMTAYTMGEDRERCLAAGMDEFMTKPLRAAELFEVVEALATPIPYGPQAVIPAHSAVQVLDQEKLWLQVDHDADLLQELVKLFLDDLPQCLEEIRAALEHNKQTNLVQAAHRLKGALGSMSAPSAFEAAARVETCARLGELANAAIACKLLETELAKLAPVLNALITASTPTL